MNGRLAGTRGPRAPVCAAERPAEELASRRLRGPSSAESIQLKWGAHAPSRAVIGALADHTGTREQVTVS